MQHSSRKYGAMLVLMVSVLLLPLAQASESSPQLPFRTGFYVAVDTACGEASNATLVLLQKDALSGAHDTCRFTAIEHTGAGRWHVSESCTATGDTETHDERIEWSTDGDDGFRRVSPAGWSQRVRYCAQGQLPEPWRDNDLSDI